MMYIRKFKSERVDFVLIIKLFFVLVLINALLRLFDTFVPIALLFGPVQYCLHNLSRGRSANLSWLFHLLPFILVSLLFRAFGAPLYLSALMLSCISYSVYVWTNQGGFKFNPAEKLIVQQITAVSTVGSVFIAVLFMSSIGRIQDADIGFDASYVLYGLLLVVGTILFAYLIENRPFSMDGGSAVTTNDNHDRSQHFSYQMDQSALESYARKIEDAINDKKLFLNAAFSMDDLFHETGIPKHHLSQVFTLCLGKTFYHYIAEKRIEEAKSRMKRNANITLEFLAFECGFNSKTTFNKYFKQVSSVTPSEYRSNLNLKIKDNLIA